MARTVAFIESRRFRFGPLNLRQAGARVATERHESRRCYGALRFELVAPMPWLPATFFARNMCPNPHRVFPGFSDPKSNQSTHESLKPGARQDPQTSETTMSQKVSCKCCYETLDKMHAVCDVTWWGNGFLLASPFALLIPKNPAAHANALVAHGLMQIKNHAVSTLVKRVHGNQKRPTFVESVRSMNGIKYGKLCDLARFHALKHFRKDPALYGFWSALGNAYESELIKAARRQSDAA